MAPLGEALSLLVGTVYGTHFRVAFKCPYAQNPSNLYSTIQIKAWGILLIVDGVYVTASASA